MQFVSYVSVDGAFGGPVAVAAAQAQELARQGHDVTLIAGWDGKASLVIPGVKVVLAPVQRMPRARFLGLRSRAVRAWIRRNAKRIDVLHIHSGRHILDLEVARAARLLGVPYFLQTHGMIAPRQQQITRILDRLLTAPAVRGARATFTLTDAEHLELAALFPGATLAPTRNGVAPVAVSDPPGRGRASEVLFIARLHPRKRVMAFAEMAALASVGHPWLNFVVIGPDEGDLGRLTEFIRAHPEVRLSYEGALPPGRAAERLTGAVAYVLPSRGEVFPMTVLEAISVDTPVVLTDDCGIAEDLRARGAALVSDGSPASLRDLLLSIVDTPGLRDRLVSAMRLALLDQYSISSVVGELVQHYERERSAQRPAVVWLTNAAPPYRLPVWEAFAERVDLEVWLLENDRRLQRDDNNRGDDWLVGESASTYRVRFLKSSVLRRGEARHYITASLPVRALRGKDAILIGGWDSPAYWSASLAARLAGVRRVGFYESHRLSQQHTSGAIAALRRLFFRSLDGVVVPGTAARDALDKEGIDTRKIEVGFNAVDVQGIRQATVRARDMLTDPGMNVGYRLLSVGQLIPRKNIAAVIDAISSPELRKATLTIVGVGDEESTLRARAAARGVADRVTFLGYVPAAGLPDVFAVHDVLVHAATEEVWGLVVNEALAAGLGVAVARSAGVAQSVDGMRGVRLTGTTSREISRTLVAMLPFSHESDPAILQHTPEAFSRTFERALLPAVEAAPHEDSPSR
ncbi:glycosyltransferase [Curtobacterium sp. PhB115]|uniref:glycosyltransferase n=1 Tax=Curtobacterium sp. PhB115 TaxID=2485173 RepID=UPI00160B78A8|nr:glycosyltransferase [Curtobacterium sp. PhB115]